MVAMTAELFSPANQTACAPPSGLSMPEHARSLATYVTLPVTQHADASMDGSSVT